MRILRSLVLLALVTTPGALLAQMTFGELILHIQGDNRITCRAIGGVGPDAEAALKPIDKKQDLVAALQRSLVFCDAALARVTDGQLGDLVPYYGHSAQRAAAMIGLVKPNVAYLVLNFCALWK